MSPLPLPARPFTQTSTPRCGLPRKGSTSLSAACIYMETTSADRPRWNGRISATAGPVQRRPPVLRQQVDIINPPEVTEERHARLSFARLAPWAPPPYGCIAQPAMHPRKAESGEEGGRTPLQGSIEPFLQILKILRLETSDGHREIICGRVVLAGVSYGTGCPTATARHVHTYHSRAGSGHHLGTSYIALVR